MTTVHKQQISHSLTLLKNAIDAYDGRPINLDRQPDEEDLEYRTRIHSDLMFLKTTLAKVTTPLKTIDKHLDGWHKRLGKEEDEQDDPTQRVETIAYTTYSNTNDLDAIMNRGQELADELPSVVENYQDTIKFLDEKNAQATASAGATAPIVINAPAKNKSVLQAKKIDLKNFTGRIRDYPEFKDNFLKAMNNMQVSDAEKLILLKGYLMGGDAEGILDDYENTDANYVAAFSVLDKRYGDQGMLINTLYTDLQFAELKSYNTKSLRYLYDEISRILRQLKNNGEMIESHAIRLTVEQKWPRYTVKPGYSDTWI